jgi:hypothetical protein
MPLAKGVAHNTSISNINPSDMGDASIYDCHLTVAATETQ